MPYSVKCWYCGFDLGSTVPSEEITNHLEENPTHTSGLRVDYIPGPEPRKADEPITTATLQEAQKNRTVITPDNK